MQAASTCKPKMITAKLDCEQKHFDKHTQISVCRISGTHTSVYCLSTWWAWDWVVVFPDWHVWQADEQAAPAEPADSSEKKDLRSYHSLDCDLWFSLWQIGHLQYQEWRLQAHSSECFIPETMSSKKWREPFFFFSLYSCAYCGCCSCSRLRNYLACSVIRFRAWTCILPL